MAHRRDTVLYLAFGSNLCAETFEGVRGVKPLSQVNVLAPELELCFDCPIPSRCFANRRYRTQNSTALARTKDYHKDRWRKGLVGVVYEVTKVDYAKIIATEGGGYGYQDIIVQCYVPKGSKEVDLHHTTSLFKAHALLAPALPPSEPSAPPNHEGRVVRPDPGYAQPSARYLKLPTDGAEEHNLPNEYKEFLYQLRPYAITSARQRLGQFIFLVIWVPIITAIMLASRIFVDDRGRLPFSFSICYSVLGGC